MLFQIEQHSVDELVCSTECRKVVIRSMTGEEFRN